MKNYDHLRNLAEHPNFEMIFQNHNFYISGLLFAFFHDKTDDEIENIKKKYNEISNNYFLKYSEPLNFLHQPTMGDVLISTELDLEVIRENGKYVVQTNGKYLDIDEIADLQAFIVIQALYEFVHHEFNQLNKIDLIQKFAYLTNALMECYGLFVDIERRNEYPSFDTEQSEQIAKKTLSELGRKAAQNKKSPYEKAGTIHAVNELLDEKQDLLQQRGGKSQLCRMILDLIAEGHIPAPNTPTLRTVERWIETFIRNKSAH